MSYHIFYVNPDENSALMILDKISIAVHKGQKTKSKRKSAGFGTYAQLVEVSQLLVSCPNNLQFDLNKLEDGDLVVGGPDSNPVACALKNLYPQYNWNVRPGFSRTMAIPLPGNRIVQVLYGFDKSDTAHQVWKFCESRFPPQSIGDIATPANFEDVADVEIPVTINYQKVSDSAFEGVMKQELSTIQSTLIGRQNFESPFWGLEFVPMGTIAKGGKLLKPLVRTSFIQKIGTYFGKIGKTVGSIKLWGKVSKGKPFSKEATTKFLQNRFAQKAVATGIGGVGVGIGGTLIGYGVYTAKQNPSIVAGKDALKVQEQNCDQICQAVGATDPRCLDCRKTLSQMTKEYNEAAADAAQSTKSVGDQIITVVKWTAVGAIAIGGIWFLFKSGLAAAAAEKTKKKLRSNSNGKKK